MRYIDPHGDERLTPDENAELGRIALLVILTALIIAGLHVLDWVLMELWALRYLR